MALRQLKPRYVRIRLQQPRSCVVTVCYRLERSVAYAVGGVFVFPLAVPVGQSPRGIPCGLVDLGRVVVLAWSWTCSK